MKNFKFSFNTFDSSVLCASKTYFTSFTYIANHTGSDDTQNVTAEGAICNLMPKGTVTATSVHSTPIMAPDYQGIYREYPVDAPVWKWGRLAIDGIEKVTNGSFDTDTDWDHLDANSNISSGVLNLLTSGTQAVSSQTITTIAGVEYTVSFEYLDAVTRNIFRIGSTGQSSFDIINDGYITTSGVREYTFIAINTTTTLTFINDATSSGNSRVDNVSMQKLVTYATDENGTALPQHPYLQANKAATNYLKHSSDIGNTGWVTQMGKTYDGTIAPDGSENANKLTTLIINNRQDTQKVSPAIGNLTYSVFVKAGNFSPIEIIIWNSTDNTFAGANFDLDAKTITLTNGSNATIEEYPNGWFRVSVTGEVTVSDATVYIYGSPTVDKYMYAWGAQVEEGSVVSNYIPTTTAAESIVATPYTYPAANVDPADTVIEFKIDYQGDDTTVIDIGGFGLLTLGDVGDGTELITNGDFSNGLDGWTIDGGSTQSVFDGVATFLSAVSNNELSRNTPCVLVENEKYILTTKSSNYVNGGTGFTRLNGEYDANNIWSFTVSKNRSIYTAYQDSTNIKLFGENTSSGFDMDSISIQKATKGLILNDGSGNIITTPLSVGQHTIKVKLTDRVMSLTVDGTTQEVTYTPITAGLITVEEDTWNLRNKLASDNPVYTGFDTAGLVFAAGNYAYIDFSDVPTLSSAETKGVISVNGSGSTSWTVETIEGNRVWISGLPAFVESDTVEYSYNTTLDGGVTDSVSTQLMEHVKKPFTEILDWFKVSSADKVNVMWQMFIGTGTATSTHSTEVYAKNNLGYYIKYPVNEPVYVGGRKAISDVELITNGTFDTDINDWLDNSESPGSIEWDSSGALKLINPNASSLEEGMAYQTITTIAGYEYILKVSISNTDGNAIVQVGTGVPGNSGVFQSGNLKDDIDITFIATAPITYLTIRNFNDAAPAIIDNVTVQELVTYNTDNVDVLLAPQPFLQSSDATTNYTFPSIVDAVWAAFNNNVTLIQASGTGIFGTTDLVKVTEVVVIDRHGIYPTLPALTGVHCFTTFIKKTTARFAYVAIGSDIPGYYGPVVNLDTGAVLQVQDSGDLTDTGYDVVDEGDFYRISVYGAEGTSLIYTFIALSDTATYTQVGFGFNSYQGDITKFIEVGHCQIEPGNKFTLPVPTTTAAESNTATPYTYHQDNLTTNSASISFNLRADGRACDILDVGGHKLLEYGLIVGDGTELVTNGTFDTDTDWTKGSSTVIASGISTATSESGISLTQVINQTVEDPYVASFNLKTLTAGDITLKFGDTLVGQITAARKYFFPIVPSNTNSLQITNWTGPTWSGTIDDISVQKAILGIKLEDASGNIVTVALPDGDHAIDITLTATQMTLSVDGVAQPTVTYVPITAGLITCTATVNDFEINTN